MSKRVQSINDPSDLKKIPESELPSLCADIREYLLQSVSRSGGHLASNLGTVELTVALHYVFDSPKDKICWDVGHQTYVHKMLTGRREQLSQVRKSNGISGFPKSDESAHDHYNTGHAGTSISQAFGEAIARDLLNFANDSERAYSAIAVVGDASIVTGMAFEAMNHAGYLKTPFLVVLNDNEMSISENVGAISYRLNSLITNRMIKKGKRAFVRFLHSIPLVGLVMERLFMRFSSSMKSMMTDNQFFQELGFRYLGPMDGHDVLQLVKIFHRLKNIDEPTLLHVVTRKGKGYSFAEIDPIGYHGVTPFSPDKGIIPKPANRWGLSKFVGKTLVRLAQKNEKIVAITPAMIEGSGLVEFGKKFPKRLFDAGIAEQHATTMSGALAKAGMVPYLCIYSTFLQRGYDQLVHDICLMNLPVRLVIDRAGCVGGDGETHQGLYDIAFISALPNITLLSASGAQELVDMLIFMESFSKTVIGVRFARTDAPYDFLEKRLEKPQNRKNYNPLLPEIIAKGKDIAIITEGFMIKQGLEIREKMMQIGVSVRVINLRCVHPIPKDPLAKMIQDVSAIFTIENHTKTGGIGEKIIAGLYKELNGRTIEVFAYPDKPINHGSIGEVEKMHGLDTDSLYESILSILKKTGLLKYIARSA